MLATIALLLAAAPPCPPGSAVVFSCPAKKKHIVVCVDASPTPAFAQYRFGPADVVATAPELVVPANTAAGFRPFTLGHQDLLSGTATTLSFQNGDVGYEVYVQDGKDAGAGVNVTQNGKLLASVACTGALEQHWERLAPYVVAASADPKVDAPTDGATAVRAPVRGGPKPDPTAGKSLKEICNDDVLLLTRYAWSELTAGGAARGAFHKNCCVPGALAADDARCQRAWPSSDAPACGDYDALRNGLFARYGYVFQDPRWQRHFGAQPWYAPRADFDDAWLPKVAQANAAALKRLGCPKASTAASCARAAVQWSLLLQRGASGQMDGVQQSDIATALAEQCNGRWSEDAAACFAAGKADCESKLTDEQRSEARAVVRAISPEALR